MSIFQGVAKFTACEKNKFHDLFLLQIFHHQLETSLSFQLLWIQTDSGGDGILALVCDSCNKTSPGTKYLKQKRLQGLQHLTTQCLRIFVSRGPHGHRTSWKCLQTSTRLRPTATRNGQPGNPVTFDNHS